MAKLKTMVVLYYEATETKPERWVVEKVTDSTWPCPGQSLTSDQLISVCYDDDWKVTFIRDKLEEFKKKFGMS